MTIFPHETQRVIYDLFELRPKPTNHGNCNLEDGKHSPLTTNMISLPLTVIAEL
jgi:hypothetical protein